MSFNPKLTQAQRAALDYIGRHRKTTPKIGAGTPCSDYMLRRLKRLGLVMMIDPKTPMLTYPGERYFTKMHPHSKFAIK